MNPVLIVVLLGLASSGNLISRECHILIIVKQHLTAFAESLKDEYLSEIMKDLEKIEDSCDHHIHTVVTTIIKPRSNKHKSKSLKSKMLNTLMAKLLRPVDAQDNYEESVDSEDPTILRIADTNDHTILKRTKYFTSKTGAEKPIESEEHKHLNSLPFMPSGTRPIAVMIKSVK